MTERLALPASTVGWVGRIRPEPGGSGESRDLDGAMGV